MTELKQAPAAERGAKACCGTYHVSCTASGLLSGSSVFDRHSTNTVSPLCLITTPSPSTFSQVSRIPCLARSQRTERMRPTGHAIFDSPKPLTHQAVTSGIGALNLDSMSTETASGSGPDIETWVLPMSAHTQDNSSDPSKPPSATKDSSILMDAINRQQYPVHPLYGSPEGAMIPTEGPATEPDGPRTYTYIAAPNSVAFTIPPSPATDQPNPPAPPTDPALASDLAVPETSETGRSSQPPEASTSQGGVGANHYPSSSGVPRLPPILQVEKQQVTTSATQVASANRRRNEAHFQCPVPGCGSTFTRRFNLRGRRLGRGFSAFLKMLSRSFTFAYGGTAVCLSVARLQEGLCSPA